MKSVFNFIVKPLNKRYKNSKKINDKELILNTDIFQHKFVSREAKVISVPTAFNNKIKKNDVVLIHHNVFRRFTDIRGVEKDSKNYYKDDMYFVYYDQIFAYKRDNKWKALDGYCFIKPICNDNVYSTEKEKPLVGIVKYSDGTVDVNDLVGFRPSSEYEFILEGERLYRVKSNFITIKYEYQREEKEYNPSWL